MFIIDILNSIIDYLDNGKTNYFPSVKTIDSYKGQLADAMQNKQLIKLADPLPAVYALMIEDNPISEEPLHRIDLLICAESKSFNKDEKQTAAFSAAAGISKYINENQGWTYLNSPYIIDKEQFKIITLLSDNRYTILSANLFIKNLK